MARDETGLASERPLWVWMAAEGIVEGLELGCVSLDYDPGEITGLEITEDFAEIIWTSYKSRSRRHVSELESKPNG